MQMAASTSRSPRTPRVWPCEAHPGSVGEPDVDPWGTSGTWGGTGSISFLLHFTSADSFVLQVQNWCVLNFWPTKVFWTFFLLLGCRFPLTRSWIHPSCTIQRVLGRSLGLLRGGDGMGLTPAPRRGHQGRGQGVKGSGPPRPCWDVKVLVTQRFRRYEVEFNHDETDHVLGNLCVLPDLHNDRLQWNQRLHGSAFKCVLCVACAVPQNMISLIVVECCLVNVCCWGSRVWDQKQKIRETPSSSSSTRAAHVVMVMWVW